MSKRVVLIKDGKVHDALIVADDFKPPSGSTHVASDSANIGDRFDGAKFLRDELPDLIQHAHQRRNAELRILEVEINLASPDSDPEIVKISVSEATRRDIYELADLGTDVKLVVWNRVLNLSASQISELRGIIAKRIVKTYTLLASIIEAIEKGRIISTDEIDYPEKLDGLHAWGGHG